MKTLSHQARQLTRFMGLLLFSSLFLFACEEEVDDPVTPEPTQNIVEIADANDDFETLVAALVAAGLDDDLSGNGPFTVFAPTDQAFEDFLAANDEFEELSDISNESLIALLQYHVASGEVLSTELSNGETIPTLLSGESLTVSISGSTVSIGNADVVEADIRATNGVIHAIDEILVPEGFVIEPAPVSLAEIVANDDRFSILAAALEANPELAAAAANENIDLTVFAPTDDAFVALLGTLSEATGNTYEELADIPEYVLTNVLQYHILGTSKTASELTSSEETLQGSSLSIDASNGVTINGDVNVVEGGADIEANNGVVHIIDGVLVPPFILNSLNTVLEPAVFDAEGRFTTLLAAVQEADLVGALTAEDATFTVFAPTNAAFDTLIANSDFADAAALLAAPNLADILLYHVLGTEVLSSAITAGASSAPALYDNDEDGTGEEIYISNNEEDGIFLNGYAQVIIPDLEEGNGVVHVIDAVLLPPTQSIAEIVVAAASAESEPQFTLLLAALQNADETGGSLVDLLSSEDETYTVFAPTDQAFIDAGFEDEAAIEAADPATLRTILLYHVIQGAVFSTDLSSGAVPTAEGSEITINVADPVTITDLNTDNEDATVVDVNILATNGVIHVIDEVLLP